MSYYWFNKKRSLAKARESYPKEKGSQYYLENKEAIKKKSRINTKTCYKNKKTRLKSIKEKDISN